MSLHKEIEQEAAKIGAHLYFKTRVYAYWDGDEIVIKDKLYCNNGLQMIGTYDKWMNLKQIQDRLKFHLDCLIAKGHIPSSLGKHLDVMRNSEISE